jgi:hypothetical protein
MNLGGDFPYWWESPRFLSLRPSRNIQHIEATASEIKPKQRKPSRKATWLSRDERSITSNQIGKRGFN